MPPFSITIPKLDERPKGPLPLVADRRLYLASDERTLVEHGSADAAFLLAPTGGAIASSDVARLGLSAVDGRVVQSSENLSGVPVSESEKVEVPASESEKVEVNSDAAKDAVGKREKLKK